jgi:hypothetical protein
MVLHEKVRWFLAVEFNIVDATEEQVNLTIAEGIFNCNDFEEYEKQMNEWYAWHSIDSACNKASDANYPQSSIENDFDSINTLAKANPILCLAALQAVTYVEDGLQIYINSITDEIEVFFEGEYMGEIAIKDGSVNINANNFSILFAASSHIKQLFPGIWE